MRKLDPQLEFLVEEGGQTTAAFDEGTMTRFALESHPGAGRRRPKVEASVLVQYNGDAGADAAALAKAGLTIHSIIGDVVTGVIDVNDIEKLSALPEVERVESARTVHPELDLAVVESRASLVHAGPPGRRGAGVIVGIVDTGCDFTHRCFRNSDGTSRILAIWDQGLTAQPGESAPAGFGYGVEYTQAQINAALGTAAPFNAVRHRDPGEHGTHVTGIAAGNGSVAGGGSAGVASPAGTFVGVAPEADIIVVANRSSGSEGIGTSANTLDAVNFIYQRAQALDRPCVVNMSLGDNLGPHDGTSLLERGIDNLLGGPGRAFVKSAGNAGSARIHAQGLVATGATEDVRFFQGAGDTIANQIDLWYRGADTFRVSLIDPSGAVQGPVTVGNAVTLTFPGGNTVRVDHRANDPFNGDKRIFMTFRQGTAATIAAGTWTIRLFGVSSPSGGRFDAWVQRGNDVIPQFLSPHESLAMTISTPGTALEVITAANYSSRGSGAGSLASSSSRGPTRDGRPAPTVAAPGTDVVSARPEPGTGDPYQMMSGTSMSAPHLTGTIALMFQKNRNRTQAEIKACLENTARTDAQTGPTPNTGWGHGKLDANGAVNCVPSPFRPIRSVVTICRSVTVDCPVSVPIFRCPSTIRICPSTVLRCSQVSVPLVTCIEPSVPRITCGISSVAQLCNGPSVIDGCPSTPAGCVDPGTIFDPAINPAVIDPGVVNPGVLNPGLIDPGRFRPVFEGDEGVAFDPMEGIEVPEQGFFDYDESWFDGE